MAKTTCACGSQRALSACCGPFLGGAEPADAEALMRSRFSAYALGRAEHLWRTLAGAHPDRARAKDDVLFEYRRASASARFRRVEILDRRLAAPPGPSQVLFVARIFEKGRDVSFAELSEFVHEGGGWRYASGRQIPLDRLPRDPADATIEGIKKKRTTE